MWDASDRLSETTEGIHGPRFFRGICEIISSAPTSIRNHVNCYGKVAHSLSMRVRIKVLLGSSVVLVTALILGATDAGPTITASQVPGVAGYSLSSTSIQSLGANWNVAQYLPPTRLTLLNQTYTGANTLLVGNGPHFTVALGTGVYGIPLSAGPTRGTAPFFPFILIPGNTGERPSPWFGDTIATWLANDGSGRWTGYVENVSAGWGAKMAIVDTTLGNSARPEWVMDSSALVGVPPWPMTTVTTINAMTMNGASVDLWTAQGATALTMITSATAEPATWMTPSLPSVSGDGFSLADGSTAPPAPASNTTPGESIDVVWPHTGSAHTTFIAYPGTRLGIFGGGFGSNGVVTWNGIPLSVSSWTPGSITAKIPLNASSGTGTVTVTPQGGKTTSWAGTITVTPIPPVWDPLHTLMHRAGKTVTYKGSHFGVQPGAAVWNGHYRWPIRLWNDHEIIIGIPRGAKGTHYLAIQVPGDRLHRNRLHIQP